MQRTEAERPLLSSAQELKSALAADSTAFVGIGVEGLHDEGGVAGTPADVCHRLFRSTIHLICEAELIRGLEGAA